MYKLTNFENLINFLEKDLGSELEVKRVNDGNRLIAYGGDGEKNHTELRLNVSDATVVTIEYMQVAQSANFGKLVKQVEEWATENGYEGILVEMPTNRARKQLHKSGYQNLPGFELHVTKDLGQ